MTLGLGLAVAGGFALQPSHDKLLDYCPDRKDVWCYERNALRQQGQALWVYGSGALLAGIGATALGYGVVAARRSVNTRWKTQIGIGAGLASLGLVAALSTYSSPRGLGDVIDTQAPDLTQRQLGGLLSVNILGFALMGSGAALITLATIEHKAFVPRQVHARAMFSPRISPTSAGLNFNLKF